MAKPTRSFQSAGRGIIAISQTVDEALPISLAPAPADSNEFNRLRAGLVTIAFVRLEEIHFKFGSSFLLPSDFDAGPLKRLMSRHKGAKLALFGHADPVGSESFNKNLSGRRAAAVYGMLVHNVSLWEKLYFEHDNNGKDEWGVGSIQVMLKRLGFDPGQIDGKAGSATNSALSDFQRSAGLPSIPIASNTVDHQTFKALARAYMDAVCVDRSSERFPEADPSNPVASPAKSGFAPFKLDKTDFLGLGADHDFKADIQGCSEFNPILRFSISEEQEFAKQENFAERNRENQPNRRVMILLFRPGTEVDTTKWPCPSYVQGVAGCKKRFFSDAALRGANGPERRLLKATNDTFQCRFFQRLHDHSEFQVVSNERLESRFALTQFEGVARLFSQNDFHIWMLLIFGADIPKDTLNQVRQELLDGAFPNCDIELVKGGIEGHLAAYDRVDKVILIDQSIARFAEKDNKAASELSAALVEEFGHFVDDRMRTELTNIGGDADLDEGAVFGFALVNFKNDIQGDIDIADYTHDGVTKTLKVNYEVLKQSTKVFFSEQERIDDARTEKFEFFGAGPGVHRGQQPSGSFGHESIEFILKDVGFKEDADPVQSELKRIYFGNWLRDFSQVIDPHIVRPPSSKTVSLGFLRVNLTKILDILAREHFNDNAIFQVTTANCGVYRADEHIDNPKGIVDETAKDSDFRSVFDPKEGEIDISIGLKKYIRTPTITAGKGPLTSLVFMAQELDAAVSLGKTNEGMRRLGAGLHTLEDYFAHSNFVELSLIELGNIAVFPWAGTRISGSPEPVLNGKFPIVTGMFGGSDTVVSFLDILGEHLQNEKPCLLKRSTGAKIALILLEDIGESGFARRLEFIMTNFETLKERFPGIFTLGCKMAEKILRWIKALVGAALVRSTDAISAAQLEYFNDLTSNNPTHSLLAKDHDDHPLHVMAARMAQAATKDVGSRMFQTWSGKVLGANEQPAFVAQQYLVHPALLNARSQPGQPPLPPGPKDLWDKMKKEAADPGNAPAIKRVEGRKWVQEQLEKADKAQEEIKKRAKEIDPDKARREAEELLKRIKELEQPQLPNA